MYPAPCQASLAQGGSYIPLPDARGVRVPCVTFLWQFFATSLLRHEISFGCRGSRNDNIRCGEMWRDVVFMWCSQASRPLCCTSEVGLVTLDVVLLLELVQNDNLRLFSLLRLMRILKFRGVPCLQIPRARFNAPKIAR